MNRMPRVKKSRRFLFTPPFKTLQEILTNQGLAALGDAYVNLLYSLYLSSKSGRPIGGKADSAMLAAALKGVGLRELLPSRVDRHKQADAAEALIVYVWLRGLTTITESVEELIRSNDAVEAFGFLLSEAKEKLSL
jgi:hypothetical protein